MASFTGFPPATFAFLRELAANNDRTWFAANKTTYEKSVLAPFHLLLADVISALAEKGIRLGGDPKKAIFRVHRDVRFSKEKLPYKTHAGAVLTHDGIKGASGILYIHIDPEGCFLAAGFHAPGPEQLGAIREAIYIDPPRFQAVRDDLATAGLTLDTSETLSHLPRDGPSLPSIRPCCCAPALTSSLRTAPSNPISATTTPHFVLFSRFAVTGVPHTNPQV